MKLGSSTRVLFLASVALLALAVAGPIPVSAAPPVRDDPESSLAILTPEQQALYLAKVEYADQVDMYAISGVWPGIGADYFCEDDDNCEPGPPVNSKTLSTRARQQVNGWFCGPASGQVVVNWSRGIINSTVTGNTTSNNHLTQNQLAALMGTTQSGGTGGANLAAGLNDPSAVLKPVPEWVYLYQAGGTGAQLHDKIVTDIFGYSMPSVLPTAPHEPGKSYWLTSWPNPISAHHWIVIRGYYLLWDGSRTPILYYNDSAAGYGGSTGAFSDPAYDVHKTNNYNNGNIVW